MRKNLIFTPLMAVLVGGAMNAQDLTTAVIAGRVTNQSGQPLQGVRVQLESPSMLGARQAATDANGQFRVPLLPNGVYSITYSFSGYITRKLTLTIVAGQVANASTSLTQVAARVETVEITGTAATINAQIDKTDTIVQTSYSADFLEMISGRSFSNIGRLAPGINNTNPVSTSDGARSHIRGGTGASTRVMVNGGTIDNMVSNETMQNLLPVGDLIESIAIIQSPLNARYGNSDGGLLSAVTSRGTNTFSGTARWNISRPGGWGITEQGWYPYRDPRTTESRTINPGNENYSKSMEFSLTGPIWKDHITFAYGTRLTPTTYGVSNTAWSTYLGSPTDPQPYNRMGTFYRDSTGDVIRRAELYSASEYNNVRTRIDQRTFNQFTVYWQVTPQHQLEYGHVQEDALADNVGRTVEMGPWDNTDTNRRTWNMAYRGIIGSSGVLEARYSSAFFWWAYGVRGGAPTPPPVRTYTIGSFRPIDGNFLNGNTSNFWTNGYIGAIMDANNSYTVELNGTGAARPTSNTGWQSLVSNGLPGSPPGDGGRTKDLVINYQHMLNTSMGTHLFDIGMQGNMADWKMRASTNKENFNTVGQISKSLTAADIYNPSGTPGRLPSYYAGKYIVFNVPAAKFSDIDPWAVNYYGIVDKYIINRNTGLFENPFGGVNTYGFPGDNSVAGPGIPLPYFYYRYGDSDGTVEANNYSYYVNDLWSVNDNHSIMAGLRLDKFYAANSLRELSSYMLPTVRLEYKWDIHGDQSRLLNVSFGQFHTFQGLGPFARAGMTPTDGNIREIRYWDKGTATPYLVDLSDLLKHENYGYSTALAETGGTFNVDPDWRSTVSTEFAFGMTRNLSIGGFWKATFVYRTWANDWDFYPGGIITDTTGTKTFERILKNASGYERKYTGLELEWEIPIHKRLTFLGSYTYNRFMHNTPDSVDNPAYWVLDNNNSVDWSAYRDEVMGGRQVWAPVRLRQPEHYLKVFLLFDVSSGRVKSSLAFDGQFTSASPINYTYTYGIGEPYKLYPELITGPGATPVPGTTGRGGMSNAAAYFHTIGLSHNDSWTLSLRYLITVPIYRKLAWMATIHIDNPFNHRGLGGGWLPSNDSGFVVYSDNPDRWGTNSGIDQSRGVWRSSGDFNGFYRDRQGGRQIYMNTGIKF